MQTKRTLHFDFSSTARKVYDAVPISIELDLAEIRIRELWNEVDIFLTVKSNVTCTCAYKELTFTRNHQRFASAETKIRYCQFELLLEPDDSFDNERIT